MRDHRKSVGVRELKTHAARILRHVREARATYLITHRGRTIGVLLPVDSENEAPHASEAVDATAAEISGTISVGTITGSPRF